MQSPPPPTTPLLLATSNPKKIRELRAILSGLPLELLTPDQLGLRLEVGETGDTFLENAVLKATAYAQAAAMPALADDSGLEIDALGGEPGVHSHRYAGPEATDAERMALVLLKLGDLPPARRTARFRCALALAVPARLVGTAEGTCEGQITWQPRGENGFGYDPIFWLPDRHKTLAELDGAEKNAISHRAKAGTAARRLIESWLTARAPGPAA